jgi:homoserine O-acetyltransferase
MHAGRHWENDWLIGPGMALDPAKYFIIVTNMFGNGLSSSPSNMPPPFDRARFPAVRMLCCTAGATLDSLRSVSCLLIT